MDNIKELPRREFVKKLTILAGSSALLASVPWLKVFSDSAAVTGVKDKVKIALIGHGVRGRFLLKLLLQNPVVEIVAVCDDYPANLNEAIKSTGSKVKAVSDYRKILDLKEIQGVVIATPLHEHAHITIDALRAGKHVFCEKAMARNYADTLAMYKTHKATGKILQIGHQRLYNLNYIKGIEMIRAGHFGKIVQIRSYWHRNNDWRRPVPSPELERKINWRLYNEYSAGLLTELASHQIHVGNWILNEVPESVMGTGNILFWKDGREVYDNVATIYNYPGGVKFIWDSVISNKHYGLEEQVQGNKGTIEFEIGKYYSENVAEAPAIVQLINEIESSVFNTISIGGPSWIPEIASQDKGDYILKRKLESTEDSKLQMEGWVESVRQDKVVPGLAEQGYYASIATLMGQEAIDNQQLITFPNGYKL